MHEDDIAPTPESQNNQNRTLSASESQVAQPPTVVVGEASPQQVSTNLQPPAPVQPVMPSQVIEPKSGPLLLGNKHNKTRLFVLIAVAAMLIIGAILAILITQKTRNNAALSSSTNNNVQTSKSHDLFAGSNVSSLDISGWQTYTDPVMKITFRYPSSVANNTVKINSPTPMTPNLINKEVIVDLLSSRLRDQTGDTLFDAITYKPGSLNDTREMPKGDIKPMTINGVNGSCNYWSTQVNKNTGRHYSCKFTKSNLVYELSGNSDPTDTNYFPGVDVWTLSLKILETFRFTD